MTNLILSPSCIPFLWVPTILRTKATRTCLVAFPGQTPACGWGLPCSATVTFLPMFYAVSCLCIFVMTLDSLPYLPHEAVLQEHGGHVLFTVVAMARDIVSGTWQNETKDW